jgi:hypothetical protein
MSKKTEVKVDKNKIVAKTKKRKTLKPNDSSWIVWAISTVILVGVIVAQFFLEGSCTKTIIEVYTPIWGILSALYLLGRVARDKLTKDRISKLAEKLGGDTGKQIASFLMYKEDDENVD